MAQIVAARARDLDTAMPITNPVTPLLWMHQRAESVWVASVGEQRPPHGGGRQCIQVTTANRGETTVQGDGPATFSRRSSGCATRCLGSLTTAR